MLNIKHFYYLKLYSLKQIIVGREVILRLQILNLKFWKHFINILTSKSTNFLI